MAVKLRQQNATMEIIKENGQVATCPFRNMITAQMKEKIATAQNEGVKIIQHNQVCTSDCALFQLMKDKDNKDVIYLSCGKGTVHEYDEIIQPDEKKVKTMNSLLKK